MAGEGERRRGGGGERGEGLDSFEGSLELCV